MEPRPSIWKIAFKYGLFIGLALVVYEMIRFNSDLQGSLAFGVLDIAILIVGVVASHRAFKNAGGGYMSYGEGLGLGSAASGIGGALAAIYIFIYLKYVNQDAFSSIYEQQRALMQDEGAGKQELQIADQISSIVQSPTVMFIATLLSYLFIGFIISLIIAAITKKDNPAEEL